MPDMWYTCKVRNTKECGVKIGILSVDTADSTWHAAGGGIGCSAPTW